MHRTKPLSRRTYRLNPLARAIAAVGLLASPLWLQAAPPAANSLPTGLQVGAGQASVLTQGSQMTVRNSNGAILNWSSFNIGAAAGVNFEQANAASKVLNRVTGNDPSQIFGSLTSNGQVWLLNPNGVLFGQGARVDVAGLVASTLRLNDNDFLNGQASNRFRLTGDAGSTATVRNEGSIRSAHGGQVLLLGARVENTGSVEAPGGSVTIAAARSVELVDTGLPNLAVRVDVPEGEALNMGRLVADGGRVDVFGAIVNQQGLVQADTLAVDAQGRVTLKASDTLMLGTGSTTQARGVAAGTTGGSVDLLGARVGLLGTAAVDASGVAGGGGIRVGGGLQGRDSSVPNAQAVWFGPEASLRADATGAEGNGGRIILWSDTATRAYGTLSARGGSASGAGGFVETSGGWLDARPAAVDVSSRSGAAGQWLLDPNNITISDTGPDSNITGNPSFSTTGDAAVITTGTIAAALNAGANVSITTGAAGASTQAGDIVMNGATLAVTPPSAVSLTLTATRDILVRNSSIVSTGAGLAVNLLSGSGAAGAIELDRATITTAGGNVFIGGARSQPMPLPDGSFTVTSFAAAVGYNPATATIATQLTRSANGVTISGSVVDAGAGTLTAYGLGAPNTTGVVSGGLRIIGFLASSPEIRLSGSRVTLGGWAVDPRSRGISVGTVGTNSTSIIATGAIDMQGASPNGGILFSNATVSAGGSGGGLSLRLRGIGGSNTTLGNPFGVGFQEVDTGPVSSVTVGTGAVDITGSAPGAGRGVNFGAFSRGSLDFSSASSVFVAGSSATGNGIEFNGNIFFSPTAGTLTLLANSGALSFTNTTLTGSGAWVFNAPSIAIGTSLLQAGAGPLDIVMATSGALPLGVSLTNSTVTTGNGNLTFGASNIISSTVLGSTTTAAPWVEYAGTSATAALNLNGSTLDAGTGSILGGGANRSTVAGGGVEIFQSNLNARTINLAGRSDTEIGLLVDGSTLIAGRVLKLDGLSAGTASNTGAGLYVYLGSTLQVADAASSSGSQMALSGKNISGFVGVLLEGGDAGSTNETRLVVSGAALDIRGDAPLAGGTGVVFQGTPAAPGGLLINALGATGATVDGSSSSGTGGGLSVQYTNVLGAQATSSSGTLLRGSGRLSDGRPATSIDNSNITTGGTLTVEGEGVRVNASLLTGENGLALLSNSAGVGSIQVTQSTLLTTAAGAAMRFEDTSGGAARGDTTLRDGVAFTDSVLQSTGANASISVRGTGGTAGGNGVSFVRSTFLAHNLTMAGTALTDSHGIFSEDFAGGQQSVLNVINLGLSGQSAVNITAPDKAGVRLGNGAAILLSGRGTVSISGDTVALGSGGGTQPFTATGDAASFSVSTVDSMHLRNATLDFSSGAGTTVTLRGDSDNGGGGRTRLNSVSINTGGGNLTASGVGVRRGSGTVAQNTLVLEGANGVQFNATTVQAGAGPVTLNGTAPNDGNPPPNGAGNNAVAFFGVNSITAGSISMSGNAGDLGQGIDVGSQAGSTLNLTAQSISLFGRGAGVDPSTLQPYAGININSASTWNAGTGTVLLQSTGNGLSLQGGLAVSGGSVTLQTPAGAAAPVTLSAITLAATSSTGALNIRAADGSGVVGDGAVNSGAGLTMTSSTLTSVGSLSLSGQGAASGGNGINFTATPMSGANVSLTGVAAVSGDGIRSNSTASGTLSLISATNLTVQGTGADNTSTLTHVGVLLGNGVGLNLTGRGAVLFTGDSVVLGQASAVQPFAASGGPASFSIRTAKSQMLTNTTLDFRAGSGTAVALLGNTDNTLGGRVRLGGGTGAVAVFSAGGDITLDGMGEPTGGGAGAPTGIINTTVRNGASGVFFNANGGVTLNAGSGNVRLQGSGSVDLPGGSGIAAAAGAVNITATNVQISGTGLLNLPGIDFGYGDAVGGSTQTSLLSVNAATLSMVGAASGTDPRTGLAAPGIALYGGGWTLTGNATLRATSGTLLLSGLTGSMGQLSATATGAMTLATSTLSASNTVALSATGASSNGSLLSTLNTSLTAGGALQISGISTDSGVGVMLLDGTLVNGGSVTLNGQSVGGPGVWFNSSAGNPAVRATSGALAVTGRAGTTAGVRITGGWQLQSGTTLLLDSSEALALETDTGGTLPRFLTGTDTTIRLAPAAPISLDASTAANFTTALQTLPSTGRLTWEVGGSSDFTAAASLSVPGRMTFMADTLALQSGAVLQANGAGDALVFRGFNSTALTSFTNTAGSGALAAPNGRWVLLADRPSSTSLGGLQPAFTAFNLAAQPWSTNASGDYNTPAAGNALGYAVNTAAINGAGLAGLLTRTYDATTGLTLNPTTWAITGLNSGDTLSFTGPNTATLADKNVGTAKPVTLNGSTVFSVADSGGRPVFGYDVPVFTANITPLAVALSGAAVANKVYDGNTTGTLASLGSVNPLAGDTLGVGGSVLATFSDRNVGTGKTVAVAGFALTGADAGNYTLVAPSTLTADITARALAITGLAAQNRVYDTTTVAPLTGTASLANTVAGDNVTLAGAAAGSFANKNVGAAKPVSVAGLALAGADAGNYTLSAPTGLVADITPATLALNGLTALSKVYDTTRNTGFLGTASVAPLAGDTVTLAGTALGSFVDKSAGSNKPVALTGLALAGADAGNYTLAVPAYTANIAPASLGLLNVAAAGRAYDSTRTATMSGALTGVLAGDTVNLGLTGQFSDANVGTNKVVTWTASTTGADAGNYTLAPAIGAVQASITPATLTYVANPTVGTVGQPLPTLSGTVTGLVGTDTLNSATTGTAAWATTATTASTVGAYAVTGSGLAALNYVFAQAVGNATALQLQAPTTADAATTTTTVVVTAALMSVQLPVTMSNPTQGRVLDVTTAFAQPGSASDGVAFRTSTSNTREGGAAAVAAAVPGSAVPAAQSASGSAVPGATANAPAADGSTAATAATAATTATTGAAGAAPGAPGVPSVPLTLEQGRSFALRAAGEAADGITFRALDLSRLPRDEVQSLLAARARYKQKVFSKGVYRLQQDPSLADVRACTTEAELETGLCIITEQLKQQIQAARVQAAQAAQASQATAPRRDRNRRAVKTAALPVIERKLALLIGVNEYQDKQVPELVGAVPDARAVRQVLEQRLGYETTVLENPAREAIVKAFNRLALEAEPNDSVIVYYAGHGVLVPVDGVETGFWLPSDVDSETPKTWLANADIARMVAAVGARQLMLVSDSCYSGQLVGKDRVSASGDVAELLKRRAAVVMSSGGDEPVADQGREGHSVFAWHFMRALEGLDQWQVGGSLYDRIRAGVVKDFPQTPQYGSNRAAGHQGNTDYLFERRELESPQAR